MRNHRRGVGIAVLALVFSVHGSTLKSEASHALPLNAQHPTGNYVEVDLADLGRGRVEVPHLDNYSELGSKEVANAVEKQIPKRIWDLNGKKVGIKGYVLPTKIEQNRMTEFLIIPKAGWEWVAFVNNRGPENVLNQHVLVSIPGGVSVVSTDPSGPPAIFRGTLRVGFVAGAEYGPSIYCLDLECEPEIAKPTSVKPKQ